MPWTIPSEGEEQNPEGYDGHIWQWQLVADHDADERRFVVVRISGTVMAMDEEGLSARITLARETHGRSEVEITLGWPEPPRSIDVHSAGVRPAGGDPGAEQREINETIEWFYERGALLWFGGHGGGTGSIENVRITTHTAHVVARDVDSYLFSAKGPSRLEAARRAKEQWDAEGRGVLLGKLEAGDTSNAELTLTINRETVKTLHSEGYRVVWTEPTNPADPIWLGQAFNDDGELLEMALGKDPEDVLLELAQALLPKQDEPSASS
jgi:hypothetical protein